MKIKTIRLDAIALHIDWDCPSRVGPVIWDIGLKEQEVKQSWWLTFRYGIRRRRLTEEQKNNGARADYFNPFIYLRVLGLCIGAAFSVSWGVDEIFRCGKISSSK